MNKLLNKALLYQWFYLGKWVLLASSIIWGIFLYISLSSALSYLNSQIRDFRYNKFIIDNIFFYLLLVIFIFCLYLFSKGIDKRNKNIFITSGPFNKKQVLFNEIFALVIVLLCFILVFMYVAICIYIKNQDTMYLIVNFGLEVGLTCFRLLIVGGLGIVYILIMDYLFTNTILTGVLMVVVPVILYLSFMFTLEYVGFILGISIYSIGIISDGLFYLFRCVEVFLVMYPDTELFTLNTYITGGTILILGIVVGGYILFRINDHIRIEKMNKIFSFLWVEKGLIGITSYLVALVLGIFLITFMRYEIFLSDRISVLLVIIPMIMAYILSYKLIKYFVSLIS